MRSCFDKKHQDMCLVWNLTLGRASHLTSDLGKTTAFAMLMNVSVEDMSTFFASEERSSTRKNQTFVATGLTLSLFGKKNKQKNDCTQHNKFGMSFVGQVVWDTEPVFFFFLWAFCFFSARPRRFGEKKSDEKHRKKSTWP